MVPDGTVKLTFQDFVSLEVEVVVKLKLLGVVETQLAGIGLTPVPAT